MTRRAPWRRPVPDRVTFTLNGGEVSVQADHPHLLAALREELDVTSPKDGCSPSGQCGCCTVMLDGKAQVACQIPLAKADGRRSPPWRASTRLSGGATPERSLRAAGSSAAFASRASSCGPRPRSTRRAAP